MTTHSRPTLLRRHPRRAGALGLAVLAVVAAACMSAEARTFFDRTNGLRAAHGVAAVAEHGTLNRKAERWAAHMAATGKLAHSNLAEGLDGVAWKYLGENVGVSEPTADTYLTIHRALEASPSHRAVMLDPEFTHMGVGVATSPDGRVWVAEVFARL